MNKKGMELSVNIIIIAAIAMIVLIIIVALLVGKMNLFGNSSSTCENNGGSCVEKSPGCGDYQKQQSGINYRCLDSKGAIDTGMVCCVGISTA
jgi:hypothetical protein